MKVVSLFSGIGGFDLGFSKRNFEIIWANDFDQYCVQTYKRNINNQIHFGDLEVLKYKIPKHDVLIGGFPCQPFSSLGSQKGFEDKRGGLIFTIIDILQKNKTPFFILENVKNFINHDKGKTIKIVKEMLEEIGYIVDYKILNSLDFGIPQRRNRVFIVGYRKTEFKINSNFIFPEGKKTKKTVFDLLDKEVSEKYFLSHKIIPTILSKGNQNYKLNPTIDTPIAKTLTATMMKMHRASQDNYYTDQINYEKNVLDKKLKSNIRRLTPNECRKLQGFPNEWVQVVSDAQAYKQFGNAVTVNVSTAIAAQVELFFKEFLNEK
ncbi:DNA (cytosine-5-)-methyltransferase [Mesoplasma florum]|nr:DNA (cytosine-5-)-methyltransferase [Mesoplasma florum]